MLLSLLLWLAILPHCVNSSCSALNYCSGHGQCTIDDKCDCYRGWGASSDISSYKSPDCSARTCPSDHSWADLPTQTGNVHRLAECSDKGVCNRQTGKCECFLGFTGKACERSTCPKDCSGHGICISMERYAQQSSALPLGNNFVYSSFDVSRFVAYTP